MSIVVNGASTEVDTEPEMPVLWVLRDVLQLCGTKFGCGVGACGACTVLVDGAPTRSCLTPVADVGAGMITTIEGVSAGDHGGDHPVQQAWLAGAVVQCGYCQPGQVLTAIALLERTPHPSDADIDAAFADVLCRCGTYQRIRAAVHAIAGATA